MASPNLTSFLFLAAIIALASCKFCDLKFSDCGSKNGKVYSVQINETCNSKKEAVLVKGTSVMINFTFSANAAESELSSSVSGRIAGIPVFIPFPLGNPKACKDSGLSCPIKANAKYQYLPLLEVKSSFPTVSAEVKWELQDKNGDDVFCILLASHIVDKN